jgi:catechol 2,3-dioxygenase-like lactoylglutathione lyase family enzyme
MVDRVQARALDHLVLTVSDVRRSLDWYVSRLGLAPERVGEWERGEVLFPSLRVDEVTVIDLLEGERTGTNVDHVCLVVDDVDLDALASSEAFDASGPPMEVWGARGTGRAVYVRDPDGNTVELRVY